MSPSTPPNDPIQAIALLQYQQTQTENTLREIQRTATEGFASINVKMDRVNELALGMSQLQNRLEAQNEGLIRAFATMDDIKRDLRQVESDNDKYNVTFGQDVDQRFNHRDSVRDKYIESQAVAHDAINKNFAQARGVFIGVSLIGGLLLSLLFWNINQYTTSLQSLQTTVNQLQLEHAKQLTTKAQ